MRNKVVPLPLGTRNHFFSILYWRFQLVHKERKGNKITDWKGRGKMISIHRQHDHLHRKPARIYKPDTRTSKFGKVSGYKVNIKK